MKLTINDVLANNGKLSTVIDNYKQRDGQIEMASYIDKAYKEQKTVIINAPTGNGKSIGGLVPAILNKDKGQTIISTATKSLQDQYANKDLPMLHKILDFESHVLKGRDNYVCNNKFEQNKQMLTTDIKSDVLEWYSKTEYGDFEELPFIIPQSVKKNFSSNSDDCLEQDCPFRNKCFYRKNKNKAVTSDVIVINHDLLALYLTIKSKYGISMFGDVYGIIVDEAHKLEEIVTKYLGFKMNVNTCRPYIKSVIKYCNKCKDAKILSNDVVDEIETICDSIYKNMRYMFKSFLEDEERTYRVFPNKIDTITCGVINKQIQQIYNKLPKSHEYAFLFDDKTKKLYEGISNKKEDLTYRFNMLIKISEFIDDYVYYVDTSDDIFDIVLNVAPIDVSLTLSNVLFNRKKELEDGDIGMVALLSATLFVNRSFDFIKSRLGINTYFSDEEYEECLLELSVPEMFDYKHQALLYLPKGIIEPSRNEKEKYLFTNQMIKIFKETSDIVDGGILGLFTSYSEMDRVYDGISASESDHVYDRNGRKVLNQRLMPRPKLIKTFKEDCDSILLATSSFWEGIDVQGESCSCVIIDRIPFPTPGEPIIEARIDKIKNNGGDWFNNYYLPIAIIALQQGFGRLIRTHKDLGMIILMDNRILTKNYGKRILRSLPDCLKTRNYDKVEVFWDIVRQKRELRRGKK